MGRHGRNSHRATPATVQRTGGHRAARRRRDPAARTGLLGAGAAMAVGAVAVVTGLLPTPGHAHGGTYAFGGPGADGNLSRADGSPTPLTEDDATGAPSSPAAAPRPASPSASPSHSRTAAHPSASAVHHASPAPTTAPPRATATPTPPTASAQAPTGQAAAQIAQVLILVNQQRAQAGCHPLTADPKLAELAGNYSAEMAARGFFDHTDPDGRTPWDRAAALGIDNLGGENIAEGQADAAAVMNAWMNSPGHRANILDCDYRTIGIGLHYATGTESGGPWWTQDFGR